MPIQPKPFFAICSILNKLRWRFWQNWPNDTTFPNFLCSIKYLHLNTIFFLQNKVIYVLSFCHHYSSHTFHRFRRVMYASSLIDVSFLLALRLVESDDIRTQSYWFFFVCAEPKTSTQTNPPPVSSAGPAAAAPPGEPDLAGVFLIWFETWSSSSVIGWLIHFLSVRQIRCLSTPILHTKIFLTS